MAERLTAVDLETPDWLLAGFDIESQCYHLAHVDRETYRRSAFLDHRIQPVPQQLGLAGAVEADRFLHQVEQGERRPVTIILHTAFCASTLLAGCLDLPGRTLVLKEPLVLSRLAQLKRSHASEADSAMTHADWDRHCRRVLALCERAYGQERVVIKPSNFANALIPEWAAPGAKHRRYVLMSSSLAEMLVSVLKKRTEAEQLMPGFLASLLQDSDYLHRVGELPLQSLDLLQQATVFWHCQRHQLRLFVESGSGAKMHSLTMRQFFDDPRDSLEAVSRFAALPLSTSDIETAVEEKVFSGHSKQQGVAYSPEHHRAEAANLWQSHQSELEQTIHWAQPLLTELPPMSLAGEGDPVGIRG